MGTDLVSVPRMERLLQRYRSRLKRFFTPAELEYAFSQRFPAQHLAARFAAKEAVAKVVGRPFRYREAETVLSPHGTPKLNFYGSLASRTAAFRQWGVTLSHTKEYALAVVWAMR